MTRRRIDWTALRQRIEAAADATRVAEIGDGEAERLLAERARELARPIAPPASANLLPLVRFLLGAETWGLNASYVWDVFHPSEVALLPGSRAPVVGLAPWLGTVLTLLDLRLVVGIATEGISNMSHVIVVGEAGPEVGLLADAVEEVVEVDPEDVGPVPEGVAAHREFVQGVTRDALLVLDPRPLFQRHGRAGEPRTAWRQRRDE